MGVWCFGGGSSRTLAVVKRSRSRAVLFSLSVTPTHSAKTQIKSRHLHYHALLTGSPTHQRVRHLFIRPRALKDRRCGTREEQSRRMLKKFVSKAAADGSTGGVAPGYVEDAFEVRTKLADFFSILLIRHLAFLE